MTHNLKCNYHVFSTPRHAKDLAPRVKSRRGRRDLGYRGFGAAPRREHQGRPWARKGGKRQARTLNGDQIQSLLTLIDTKSNVPESDRLKVELSFRAGLRVSEIATLRLEHVTDASGNLSPYIRISAQNSKTRRERQIPMHPRVASAITAFRAVHPDLHQFAISRRFNKIREQSTHAVTVWFSELYRWAGLEGCSSHSGRRTMITQLARKANEVGASLRDVQIIAGHARLDTTEGYIEPCKSHVSLINTLNYDRTELEQEPAARGGDA